MKVIAVNGKVLLANGKAVKPPAVGSGFAETIVTDAIANHIVSSSWSPSVTAVEYIPKKYYYNDVLLPEIPANVLASYPYAFIGFIASTGKYQILASANPMYFNTTNSNIVRQNSNTEPFLYCLESDEAWTAGTSGNYGWSIDSDRQLIWSNHDIPNGSATATEIYFEGSEPVPVE